MQYLQNKKLDKLISNLKQPVLGICLGMQLLCKFSEENKTTCLGIFDEEVKHFSPSPQIKIPHMGWNEITSVNGWVEKSLEKQYAYFVHSYYVPINKFTSASSEHGVPFSAALHKDNFYAVQFHPEKSALAGEQILEKFLSL
jgi:glutamine amidotransferase